MNILIITHALHQNYGGLLQAYALQSVCKKLGHSVVTDRDGFTSRRFLTLLKRNFIHSERFIALKKILAKLYPSATRGLLYALQKKETSRFTKEYINTIDFFGSHDRNLDHYDAIIVGSDQVWRPSFVNVANYFCQFAKDNQIKRISYAASFGVDHWDEFSDELTHECKELAQLFDGISVRENSGVELCRKHLGVEAEHVLDPTMLIEKEEYLSLIEKEDLNECQDVMMTYILDESDEKRVIVKALLEKLKLPCLKIGPKESLNADITNYNNCIYPSVSKWLNGFRNAKFVVTDSFHGTVFALIFNVPFIVIANNYRGVARFHSLLDIYQLRHRIISSLDELESKQMEDINFEQVNAIRSSWQQKSLSFLTSALSK